jgi:hypothetical protein
LLARHPEFELTAGMRGGMAVLAALATDPPTCCCSTSACPADGVATVDTRSGAPWALERPPRVVFVTASEEHAIRAFTNAVDYL